MGWRGGLLLQLHVHHACKLEGAVFFFNCSEATPMRPSTTPFTCVYFKPVVSATEARTADWIKAPLFLADVMDLIAGAMAEKKRKHLIAPIKHTNLN